jgi:hypothetical protein
MTFGEAASAIPSIAPEAQMTHNPNHGDQPVQKAGQSRSGTSAFPEFEPNAVDVDGADRAAGRESMSKKTSTAALESFRHGLLTIQRRAPRQHSTGLGPSAIAQLFFAAASTDSNPILILWRKP